TRKASAEPGAAAEGPAAGACGVKGSSAGPAAEMVVPRGVLADNGPAVSMRATSSRQLPPNPAVPVRIDPLDAALLIVGTTPVTVRGADLTKIERTIAKEPAYKSKPKYCLLVFGPEAKTRVWLVLDGDTLYVDRNGNGDLTETGERFVLALDEYG